MAEVWELTKQAVVGFYEVVVAWLATVELDPRLWSDTTRMVVLGAILLLVMVALLRRRRTRTAVRPGWPQFLVTNGSIALLVDGHAQHGENRGRGWSTGSVTRENPAWGAAAAPADGGTRQPALLSAPADAHYQLRMTVNNLNPYAVQLLELAVQTGAARLPVIADAAAVLPPHGAVDVAVDLFDLPGERGTVALYLHTTAGRQRSLRLLAPLEWEPWNQRYRVKGTALRVEASSAPASETFRRRRLGQLRRQRLRARVGGVLERVRSGVVDLWQGLNERRISALARAAAGREARATAAMKKTAISVPLAPSRSSAARQDGAGVPGVGPERDSAAGAAGNGGREAREVGDENVQQRQRLDFPDEF